MQRKNPDAPSESQGPRIRSAPTEGSLFRYQLRYQPDDVQRRARMRLDETDPTYPTTPRPPEYAFVNLLQPPRDGQPVVWISHGKRTLTLYGPHMRSGGIAFIVTGLQYGPTTD